MSTSSRSSSRLIAVDPSLTASGWALFSLESAQPLSIGVLSPPGASLPLAQRLTILQAQIAEVFEICELKAGDFLICEGPAPLVLNPNSAMKVERVRGIFETLARSNGLRVPGRLNPRTVQSELLGMKGKQLARAAVKAWARETATTLFGDRLRTLQVYGVPAGARVIPQDIIDALLIGSLAVSKVRMGLSAELEIESLFAKRGSRRSSGSGRGSAKWTEAQLETQLETQLKVQPTVLPDKSSSN